MPLDASEPSGTREEDDDFGEIRIAETDAIPVSQEASECQRTTSSFLSILARFRLRQAMLTSPNRVPSVDKDLLNAFLSAEGPRFVQLGSVICDAIKDGILRLTANTVNVTLERLEDVTQSYVYRGHEGLLRMTLAFMTGSIVVWLSPHGDKYELLGRVFHLADALRNRASRKALPSWRVRLDLVRFIDEYLDYDPDQTAWQEYTSSQSQMITDGSVPLATDIVSAALTDVDSRVRFRGATSAAGTMYLSSLPPELHLPFYQTCVEEQPRELRHWDAFITDMLFKLNCCVTSPQVRAATIYHLYEVPQAIHDYDGHLENGLSTVATRLGLSGIAPLSLAHAPLVFMSQILAQQSPMRVPHRLYGFSTRKAFAIHALESAGSQLVLLAVAENVRSDPESRQYVGAGDTLTGICAAAGIPSADIIVRHFPAAAAHFLADPTCPPFFNVLGDDFTCEHAVRLIPSIIELVRGATLPKDPLADNVEEVITNLFVLLDLADTDEDVVEILRRKIGDDHGAPTVYATLMSCQPPVPASALALLPGASAERIMDALVYLSQNYKTISSAKVLFNTLTRLFHRINDDFLISEQYRHLRGIALATSLYGEELTHPAILGYFLRETLPLLKLSSVAPAILSMLKFGFEQISRAPKAPDDFDQLIIALGSTRVALTDDESNEELVQQFDSWIVKQAPVWQDVEAMRPALTVARSTWPEHLANVLDKVGSPSFNEICDSSERLHTTDVLPMCEAMVKSLEPDPAKNKDDLELFQRRAFWHIKRHLPPTPRNVDSVSAFIDILYAGHGQVHPPGLDMAQLPPGIAWLQEMLRKKEGHPSRALRTMMLDRIVLMARLPAYQARTAALSTLQMLLACIKDEGDSKNGHGTEKSESRATNDFLALLTPASPPPPSSVPAFSTLVTDDTWLKHARDTSIWSTALATFIAFTLAVRERFYAALPDLFAAIPSAAGDLLPLLVQASLAVEADQRGDLKERHSTYTKYLTKVLASPQSSVDTLRVIVDISLHLRYLNPPYKRSDELAFEKWLDIDPMLLSEAALRCGNYATALMYLENVRSDAKSAPRDIDMFDNRVQKVGARKLRPRSLMADTL
jgi:ataxia telangiectasia mutated family protein